MCHEQQPHRIRSNHTGFEVPEQDTNLAMAFCGCCGRSSKRLRASPPQTIKRGSKAMISLNANRGQVRMQSNPLATRIQSNPLATTQLSNQNFRPPSASLSIDKESEEAGDRSDGNESRPLVLQKGSVACMKSETEGDTDTEGNTMIDGNTETETEANTETVKKLDSSGLWSLPTSPAKSMSSSSCDNDEIESQPYTPVMPIVSWSNVVETAMTRSVDKPKAKRGDVSRPASSLAVIRSNLQNHDRTCSISRSVSIRDTLMARKSAGNLFSKLTSGRGQHTMSTPDVLRVELQVKDSLGFGLMFRGCKSKADGEQHGFGVFVSDIKPHSVAYNSGITPGLQVCSINGMDFRNCSLVELRVALNSFSKAKNKPLQFELQENQSLVDTCTTLNRSQHFRTPWDYTSPSCTIKIVLKKGSVGFGIYFGGAKNKVDGDQFGFGVFVERVRADSAAAKESMIFPGVQIVEMNGVNLRNATLIDLRKVVGTTTKTMTLTLQKPDK